MLNNNPNSNPNFFVFSLLLLLAEWLPSIAAPNLFLLQEMVSPPPPPSYREILARPPPADSNIGIRANPGLVTSPAGSESSPSRQGDLESPSAMVNQYVLQFNQSLHMSNSALPTNCSMSGPRGEPLLATPLSIPDSNPLTNRAYGSSSNPSYSCPRRDLSIFTGKDVHGWLYRAEQLMDSYNVSSDLRVRMVALYLEEQPLEWYRGNMRAKEKPLSWDEFKKGLVSMYDNSMTCKVFEGIPQPLAPLPLLIRQLCDKIPQSPSRASVTKVSIITTTTSSLAPVPSSGAVTPSIAASAIVVATTTSSTPSVLKSCNDSFSQQEMETIPPSKSSTPSILLKEEEDKITDDSPAAKYGLQLGDRIIKFGNVGIGDEVVCRFASEAQPNEGLPIPLVIMRQSFPMNLTRTPTPSILFGQVSILPLLKSIHTFPTANSHSPTSRSHDNNSYSFTSTLDTSNWLTFLKAHTILDRLCDGRRMFGRIPERDCVLWKGIISGCVQNGLKQEALDIFYHMQSSGVQPDSATLTSFLIAFSNSAGMNQGKEIHAYILRNRIIIDAFLKSALIDIYLKDKDVDTVQKTFESTGTVDVVIFSAMISGYVLNGLKSDALEMSRQLVEIQLKPNEVALANVLPACSGLTRSYAIPFVTGEPVIDASCRTSIGGYLVTDYLKQLLSLKYPSHISGITLGKAEDLKMEHCYVVSDYLSELQLFQKGTKEAKEKTRCWQPPWVPPPPRERGPSEEELARKAVLREKQGQRLQHMAALKRSIRISELEDEFSDLENLLDKLDEVDEAGISSIPSISGFVFRQEIVSAIQQVAQFLRNVKDEHDESQDKMSEASMVEKFPLINIPNDILAPEQIMFLCNCKEDVKNRVHAVNEKFTESGLRSLATARQEVLEENKDNPGGPWQFVGLLPLFDPPRHDSWELDEIFATGIHLAVMSVTFFWTMKDIDFFYDKFGIRSLRHNEDEMMVAIYPRVSIVSQALIVVTRSRRWFFAEQPELMFVTAFFVAQLVATLIAVYADWGFAHIKGIGWGWAGVIWLYNVIFFFPLNRFKFGIRSVLRGKAWDNLLENKTAFTTKKDYGQEEREAQWDMTQRTLHGLKPPETTKPFADKNSYRKLSEIAEHAKKQVEVTRLRELHTPKDLSIIQFPRSVKPPIYSCFGDMALAMGKKFKKYMGYAMPILLSAGELSGEPILISS